MPRPKPPEELVVMSVRVPVSVKARAAALADDAGYSLAEWHRAVVVSAIDGPPRQRDDTQHERPKRKPRATGLTSSRGAAPTPASGRREVRTFFKAGKG